MSLNNNDDGYLISIEDSLSSKAALMTGNSLASTVFGSGIGQNMTAAQAQANISAQNMAHQAMLGQQASLQNAALNSARISGGTISASHITSNTMHLDVALRTSKRGQVRVQITAISNGYILDYMEGGELRQMFSPDIQGIGTCAIGIYAAAQMED